MTFVLPTSHLGQLIVSPSGEDAMHQEHFSVLQQLCSGAPRYSNSHSMNHCSYSDSRAWHSSHCSHCLRLTEPASLRHSASHPINPFLFFVLRSLRPARPAPRARLKAEAPPDSRIRTRRIPARIQSAEPGIRAIVRTAPDTRNPPARGIVVVVSDFRRRACSD